jgi:superfamily II DNA or RNA helicase
MHEEDSREQWQGSFQGLSTLHIETEYRSGKDDPVGRFYKPCLQRAIKYRRAVGYFRSSVYTVIGQATIEFALRGGTMQLICSPELDNDDIDSIALGYARRSERVSQVIRTEFDALLADPRTNHASRVLATLIAAGALEIKLAVRADSKGLYHEKMGLFSDSQGQEISFRGSANETWSGWHNSGNFEAIEVFCSWRGGLEAERVKKHREHFERLWQERDADVEVFPFPLDAIEHLKSRAYPGLAEMTPEDLTATPPRRSPLPHQVAAIDAWEARQCRGVLEHATGSGKTFTAITALKKHSDAGLPSIVVVPSRLLLEQWADEVRLELPDVAILLAGGGHIRWKARGRLSSMTDEDCELGGRVTIATMQTASSEAFRSALRGGNHLLLVADEVHQVGSPQNSQIMEIQAGKRLGLSATPTRYGDPDGTQRIFDYFGNVIPPAITLVDAIAAGRLVPYEYHPHLVSLSATEADEWRDLSKAIRQDYVRQKPDANGARSLSERGKLLLIRRSRIAKKAVAKVGLAVEVVCSEYQHGQSWLIYCEDSSQLEDVMSALRSRGFSPVEYHSRMAGDRDATMSWFLQFGGLLASVRCLDEGVDIPAVSHALILASSQNPRQFIQRRGRVLRKSPNKQIAVIHDAIVVPLSISEEPDQRSLLQAEMVRAMEFAANALNRSAGAELRAMAMDLGINTEIFEDQSAIEEEEEEL